MDLNHYSTFMFVRFEALIYADGALQTIIDVGEKRRIETRENAVGVIKRNGSRVAMRPSACDAARRRPSTRTREGGTR